ncbi:MAG TPA: dual specificity protein phosphatase [Solirubrobacteraceae bacterium]|jgi:protein-tyrosine phosphatase|nr:dual specificity protein phosphatase [Solirubrobacteraceae bacterium]
MSDWFEHFGYAEVADDLLIGAYPQDRDDVATLRDAGVTRVLNLVQDVEYDPGGRDACSTALAEAGIEEQRVEIVDYGNLLPGQLELATSIGLDWLEQGERVYVHCRAGMQRSATVAAALVMLRDEVDAPEALERVRERKPSANPLAHQRRDLLRWWERRRR